MVASQNQRAGIIFDKGRTTRRFTFDSISSGGIRAISGNSHTAMLKGISIGRKGKGLRMMPFSGLNLRVSSLSPDTTSNIQVSVRGAQEKVHPFRTPEKIE
jgi:hypothetical protein